MFFLNANANFNNLSTTNSCYELIKAILVIQVLRPKGEFAIMFDMLEERAS